MRPLNSILSAKRPNNPYILKSVSCSEIISIQTNSTSSGEADVVRVFERKTPFCSKIDR